ncbi:DUF1129 family protein [Weissella diestrammenae]|uniref:DUF1129 family protein n=1 Tax=Weissella diestrammenae TaxID=1162633 RepID=A0A7G9T742_9LACO|nr:DUF1129 family protein [Weissella diestrammenae]MCM0582484.1 DUF1129 family protein [Weissella diestrammenae]QNN75917.1 DUF1129 family protein [Weissella diestrammenae]
MTEENELKMPTRQDLATSGLSKRNQQFVYAVVTLVSVPEKQLPLVQNIQNELLAGQKVGKTARQIYGTPEAALGITASAQQKTKATGMAYANYKFGDLAIDNTLTFLMLFSLMFGITLLFQKTGTASQNPGAAGLTALIITAGLGGILFAFITKLTTASTINRWLRIVTAILAFILWFAIYLLVSLIPKGINPILPGYVYLIIAVVTFFGFRAWRKRTGITGGFLGSTQRPNR